MKKVVFIILGIIGVVIISILALTSDIAFENIPAVSSRGIDAPFCVKAIISGSFLYLILLSWFYNIITHKK